MPAHRKPTQIKVIQGTYRKDRDPTVPWTPEPSMLTPPDWLSDVALDEWHRIAPELCAAGVLSKFDLGVFTCYCISYGELIDAELAMAKARAKAMTTKGLSRKSKNGETLYSPDWNIVRTARREYIKYAVMLGLTPVDRAKVNLKSADAAAGMSDEQKIAKRFFDQ